jgi:diguanylate cyclase (GGDEF)-like protein
MELKRYFSVIKRWWWLVAICFIVVTIASFIFSINQPPRYRSSVALVVSPKETIDEISTVRQSLDTLDKPTIINTYSEVIRSRLIYDRAQDSLGLPNDERSTVEIFADPVQNTNLINIDAEGTNPLTVYNMANAVTEEGISYIDNLYELFNVKILDQAQMPLEPFSPNVLRDVGLGILLGLMLGVIAAFFFEYLRRPLESRQALAIIDAETGLYNKRYFMQRLREEVNRTKRNNQPLATCLISLNELNGVDFDQMKNALPAVRRQLASYLKSQMRQGEILARWSDEQMAWLMLDANENTAKLAVKRLNSKLEQAKIENEANGQQFFFSGNYGVVIFSDGMKESDLMQTAEKALQQAEISGSSPVIKSIAEPDSNSRQSDQSHL